MDDPKRVDRNSFRHHLALIHRNAYRCIRWVVVGIVVFRTLLTFLASDPEDLALCRRVEDDRDKIFREVFPFD